MRLTQYCHMLIISGRTLRKKIQNLILHSTLLEIIRLQTRDLYYSLIVKLKF
nr:MAG TPA: hypothetical protein [Crassvirales sp.]